MNKYKKLSFVDKENNKRYFQDEHRYIMENILGRKLKRNEVVHHKNGDKSDNRLENLEVMTLSEHGKFHSIGRKMSEESKKKLSEIGYHRPNLSCRRKSKEDIIEIAKKYKEFGSYREVDRYFNFANRTTRDIIVGKIYYEYQPLVQKILKEN